jgi:hypothetical protein
MNTSMPPRSLFRADENNMKVSSWTGGTVNNDTDLPVPTRLMAWGESRMPERRVGAGKPPDNTIFGTAMFALVIIWTEAIISYRDLPGWRSL